MKDRLRTVLARYGVSILQGTTFNVWWGLLKRHHFRVDLPYLPRALLLTASSLLNSVIAQYELNLTMRRNCYSEVPHPLFIIGHFRSGTTHFHNLLSLDKQFLSPTLFQCLFPLTYASTQALMAPLATLLMRKIRPQDSVAIGVRTPAEDEFALCSMTGLSPYLGWVFPGDRELYDRYIAFADAPEIERAQWKKALIDFVQKVAGPTGRRPLLKSPLHTARIRLLLEVFPDARFIHIHRNPFELFQSTKHMWEKSNIYWRLNNASLPSTIDDCIFKLYETTYANFFNDKSLIRKDRFYEIGYAEIEREPIARIKDAYQALGLGGFDDYEPALKDYVQSIAEYRKNIHNTISEYARERITREWRKYYEVWGYS